MRVDVRESPPYPSSTAQDKGPVFFVIVVTLASIALLIFSLRVYTRGKLLHCFGIDDYLGLMAATCLIGIIITFACLANLDFGKQSWNEDDTVIRVNSWRWASTLLNILAIGFAKFAIALFLLRNSDRKSLRRLLYVVICLLIALISVWFGTTLLRCVPVAAAWDTSTRSGDRCMSRSAYTALSLVNNCTNTGTDLMLVFLAIFVAHPSKLNWRSRMFLIALLSLGFIACGAAIIRTKLAFRVLENDEIDTTYDISYIVWGVVESSTALTAASLPTLKPLVNTVFKAIRTRKRPSTVPTSCAARSNHSSYQSRYSSRTVIHRPNTAYAPSFSRFHDDISNLDFDIETPATRTRTHTMRSRTTHSRNVSDWSQFSGFTYYTNPTEPPELEHMRSRSAGVSMIELEDIVKGLGLGKITRSEQDVRPAIAAMDSQLPHERDLGMNSSDVEDGMGDDESRLSTENQDHDEQRVTIAKRSNTHAM